MGNPIRTYHGLEVAGRRVRANESEAWRVAALSDEVPYDWQDQILVPADDIPPSLATALGELTAAREALRRRGHEQECPEFDYDAEPDCCTCGWTAALSGFAGELAAEVLRAAKEVRDDYDPEEIAKLPVATRMLCAAVDALLTAYPDFGKESA